MLYIFSVGWKVTEQNTKKYFARCRKLHMLKISITGCKLAEQI